MIDPDRKLIAAGHAKPGEPVRPVTPEQARRMAGARILHDYARAEAMLAFRFGRTFVSGEARN